ncbi:Eco57I restriction-modification methylase domain-containing protein [Dyadobacter fanqingshengii]|uniref:site-specific DNA-methyltransferase (adenine-specific) n=1 Tax=Dyadobacter fanqingshengii TaxID=2906443 RepID=A0A9X1TH13_9BACT|nr:N-6 DNA methylase [Dyadobacter fanqingshengii]MCF0041092.1 N-6 DNA methylase [Dyadobacter fanqingshengii]USJ37181.1 N-6 DNA methylase [Dyadobacter fanqingshengii]
MASKTRTYEKKKLLGQVYTPLHIVEKILSDAGFYNADLSNKKILDPACGDGRFLVPIVEHIIRTTDNEQLVDILNQIYGWDIDRNALEICRKNLDALVDPLGISIKWNLKLCDALKQVRKRARFDFIIGNPPYIRIQHLPLTQRTFIQSHYSFCKKGSTDAYIAFFELATTLLSTNGTCGFITPNGFLTSETGRPLRSYFHQNKKLKQITNYGSVPVFANTATYSAITIFGNVKQENFTYEQCENADLQYTKRQIHFSELSELKPWQLSVNTSEHIQGQRLGDICQISVGVTTLADAYYLFSIISEDDNIVYAKSKNGMSVYLEKTILKPIIKASKLKSSDDPVTEYILFPYQKDAAGKQRIISENILQEQFPQTFSYLLKVKHALDRRDNGKPNAVAWYAFGRAQGLDSTFGKKIVFSPMNLAPNFVLYENPEVTVYSGYFIKYDGDYDALLAQLNSPRMAEFIAIAGRDFQGGYKGYNKKIIENFIIILPE